MFDSSLPIGSFNFSNGIEEAFHRKLDMTSVIKTYYHEVILRGDAVAVKMAFDDPTATDELVYASKLTKELKSSSVYLGRSLANLDLCENEYLKEVKEGRRLGTYPVVLAQTCKCLNIDKYTCSKGLAYSEVSQLILSAVRLGAMDFKTGQRLLLGLEFEDHDDFEPSFPLIDILSKAHERREVRVFES
ncbi:MULTISPECIES: urease accessory protein UreF [Metallosphaera]|uniref:urease accessory protein UreF n=1 Tax=Metallosphaera TaxID=41980 RepID=UPI001F238BB0|nr:urease accessory UreF family protein [Metallosphaera cuprina]